MSNQLITKRIRTLTDIRKRSTRMEFSNFVSMDIAANALLQSEHHLQWHTQKRKQMILLKFVKQ